MLKNYMLIGLRNLWKRKVHSFINITGLALGIASCLLVFIYVRNEVTYDHFHENASQLYRLNVKSYNNTTNEWKEFGIVSPVMVSEFSKQAPELINTVQLKGWSAFTKVNDIHQNELFLFADASLFEMFSFSLVEGESKTFETDPNSIIITEKTAERLFPNEQAVGQTLEMELGERYETMTVKAVIKNIPFNSSIRFGMVLPFEKYRQIVRPQRFTTWLDQHIASFIWVKENNIPDLEKKLTLILQSNLPKEEQGLRSVILQPLSDIHLNAKVVGGNGVQPSTSFTASWLLIGIGAFLLLIACINFINLSIGMALPRAPEIGLRKVAGAKRQQIVVQFMGEALITCLFSLSLAIMLVDLFLPTFGDLTNRRFDLIQMNNFPFVIALTGTLLLTAFLAGMYPALVASAFNPIQSLKGEQKTSGRTHFTKGLIVVQFVFGIMFFLGSITIQKQLRYISNFDLGYNDNGLIAIDIFGENGNTLIEKFRNALTSHPEILSVTGNSGSRSRTFIQYEGKGFEVNHDRVDYNFFDTHGIKLSEGRKFEADHLSDQTDAIIVNRAFVKLMDLKDPVGMRMPFNYLSTMSNPVIVGVMDDFHYESLHGEVDAMVFYVNPEIDLGRFIVRVDPDHIATGLEVVQNTWHTVVPNRPFQYAFIEENNQQMYAVEQKQKEVVSFASIFALFISCLGLFGLSSLAIAQRTKEIGIRKILGATLKQIAWMVSSEFIVIILIANAIAWPVSYYFLDQWLTGFTYHISMGWSGFIIAGVSTLLLAILTVSVQSIKAALANPVDSLRNE